MGYLPFAGFLPSTVTYLEVRSQRLKSPQVSQKTSKKRRGNAAKKTTTSSARKQLEGQHVQLAFCMGRDELNMI